MDKLAVTVGVSANLRTEEVTLEKISLLTEPTLRLKMATSG